MITVMTRGRGTTAPVMTKVLSGASSDTNPENNPSAATMLHYVPTLLMAIFDCRRVSPCIPCFAGRPSVVLVALLTAAPYTIAAVGTIANAWHSKRCSASLTWFLSPKEETQITILERRFQ